MADTPASQLWRPAAILAWAAAAGVLTRRAWGPLLETNLTLWLADGRVAWPALTYAAVSAALAGALWMLTQLVEHGLGYRGLDRPALVAVALLAIDVVANLWLAASGAPGFALYPIPLGVTFIVSYPQFMHFTLGAALIAVGYSLLRLPPDAAHGLHLYARLQIVAGAMMATLLLVRLWPLAAAAAYGALGLLFWEAGSSPTRLPNR